MDTQLLKEKIIELKSATNTIILAHLYQSPDILEIADITGDSFALAKAATEIQATRVIMCGVRFMAESVKILSPKKTVILPEKSAGCPMAEMISPEDVETFIKEHPDFSVVAYINTTAELKAVSDVCVTSSSAVKIISNFPSDKILFIPDKNLGDYIRQNFSEKQIITMDGCCPYHNSVDAEDIIAVKKKNPTALVAAHPECKREVLQLADMTGATSEIIKFALNTDKPVISVTERGVTDYLNFKHKTDRFIQPVPSKLTCKDMKITTLRSVYNALINEGGEEIKIDEALRIKAKSSIDNMLKYGG